MYVSKGPAASMVAVRGSRTPSDMSRVTLRDLVITLMCGGRPDLVDGRAVGDGVDGLLAGSDTVRSVSLCWSTSSTLSKSSSLKVFQFRGRWKLCSEDVCLLEFKAV